MFLFKENLRFYMSKYFICSTNIKVTTLASFAVFFMFPAHPAEAAIIINATETISTVVFSYTGSINTSDLGSPVANVQFYSAVSAIRPFSSAIGSGVDLTNPPTNSLTVSSVDSYYNVDISGPFSFGTGNFAFTAFQSGDIFAFAQDQKFLGLPNEYVSGQAISGFVTFDISTFASLGVTPGTYVWTLPNKETITLNAGASAVPEPLTILGAVTATAFGAGFKRRLAKSLKDKND